MLWVLNSIHSTTSRKTSVIRKAAFTPSALHIISLFHKEEYCTKQFQNQIMITITKIIKKQIQKANRSVLLSWTFLESLTLSCIIWLNLTNISVVSKSYHWFIHKDYLLHLKILFVCIFVSNILLVFMHFAMIRSPDVFYCAAPQLNVTYQQ